MPGFMLHSGAAVQCLHAGTAQPTVVNPRVTVSAQPIVTPPALCDHRLHLSGYEHGRAPCATRSSPPSPRVTAMGQPVLLIDSQATCVPTGTPF